MSANSALLAGALQSELRVYSFVLGVLGGALPGSSVETLASTSAPLFPGWWLLIPNQLPLSLPLQESQALGTSVPYFPASLSWPEPAGSGTCLEKASSARRLPPGLPPSLWAERRCSSLFPFLLVSWKNEHHKDSKNHPLN